MPPPTKQLPSQPINLATGQARLIRWDNGGVLLEIDGDQHSFIDPADPLHLEFEYMTWMFAAISQRFEPTTRWRALHLGGGACALPRALIAAFQQSRHLVAEIDPILAKLVRHWFDLPRSPALRIRVGDGAAVLASRPAASADLIIRDAFANSQVPPQLTGLSQATAVRRVLTADGLYLANCAGPASLTTAKADLQALATIFPELAVIAEPGQLRGRRWGNVVVLAGAAELAELADGLIRRLAGLPFPARLLSGRTARTWAGLT